MGIAAIDIFPHQLTTRINYNGREDVKTHMGGFCTIFYVFCLVAITVYFAVPIVAGEDPTIEQIQMSTPTNMEVIWNDDQLLWFDIQYWETHYKLGKQTNALACGLTTFIDRTKIDIYID